MRGTVVRAIATTMTQAFGPTMATATSASMICGNAMITSIPRIRMSSSALREYAATRPIITPATRPMRSRDDGHHQDAAAAVQHPAEHVLAQVVRPEHRLAARVGVGRSDRGARAVGGDVWSDDRQQDERSRRAARRCGSATAAANGAAATYARTTGGASSPACTSEIAARRFSGLTAGSLASA